MHSWWRKLCGLALGIALLPSLAGGGACLEHVAHALSGSMSPDVSQRNAHAAHVAVAPVHASHAGHGMIAPGTDGAGSMHEHPVVATTVAESPASNCCTPSGAVEHCAGAAGCSVSAVVADTHNAAMRLVASRGVPSSGALSPPGPARAPEVPPPRA